MWKRGIFSINVYKLPTKQANSLYHPPRSAGERQRGWFTVRVRPRARGKGAGRTHGACCCRKAPTTRTNAGWLGQGDRSIPSADMIFTEEYLVTTVVKMLQCMAQNTGDILINRGHRADSIKTKTLTF